MTSPGLNPLPTGGDSAPPISGADVAIAYALQQLGKPYIWGGVGPNGFDCSGLMMMAYKQANVTIPRTSQMQMRTGQAIGSVADSLPGDLMFPYVDGSHVVMYLGNNQIVEAPQTGIPVHVVKYYASAGGIRRIVAGGGHTAVVNLTNASGGSGGISSTQDAAGAIQSINNVLGSLTNSKDWASFGYMVGGLALVIFGLYSLIGKDALKISKTVLGSA